MLLMLLILITSTHKHKACFHQKYICSARTERKHTHTANAIRFHAPHYALFACVLAAILIRYQTPCTCSTHRGRRCCCCCCRRCCCCCCCGGRTALESGSEGHAARCGAIYRNFSQISSTECVRIAVAHVYHNSRARIYMSSSRERFVRSHNLCQSNACHKQRAYTLADTRYSYVLVRTRGTGR